jgi:NADH dehydrogenase/NADH:ubiquinone oxidoreductase subunit G
MLQVSINHQTHEVREGTSILSALGELGIEVPSLCADDK